MEHGERLGLSDEQVLAEHVNMLYKLDAHKLLEQHRNWQRRGGQRMRRTKTTQNFFINDFLRHSFVF